MPAVFPGQHNVVFVFLLSRALETERPYHRGDLKHASIETGIALWGNVSGRKFTLREIAGQAVGSDALFCEYPLDNTIFF